MIGRLALVAVTATVGYAVGWIAGAFGHFNYRADQYPFLAERVPLPHHVPPVKGGAALRFAMVHDILHQRYPRHGPAYYTERVRVARQKHAALAPDDPATFTLTDDLAVALDRLGRGDEAAELLRDKLTRQLAGKRPERDLYTTYANLGTVLTRIPGRGIEGLALVRKSVEVNPTAHFGRERWQAQIDAYRLAEVHTAIVTDALGNRLDLSVEMALNREATQLDTQFGRPTDIVFSRAEAPEKVPAFFEPGTDLADPARWEELRPIRDHITRVGRIGDDGRGTIPFDEPTVAIVGIWRQVGGPDPHLALALGETMLRVGQRHLAWAAFERAHRLAESLPIPVALREHCRARQAELEKAMTTPGREWRNPTREYVGPLLTAAEVAALRPRFDAELAHGVAYQRAYQEFEAKQIAAGVPLDDPHFYDAFHAGREPIASPVGPEEWFAWVPRGRVSEYTSNRRRSWGTVGAGLVALAAAGVIRWRGSGPASRGPSGPRVRTRLERRST